MALTRPALAAAVLLLAGVAPSAHAAPDPPHTTAQIVVYKHDVENPPGQTRKRERALGFVATQRYRHALGGFAARLSADQVAALRADPSVAAVVPDRPVSADSVPVAGGETVPPGIARIGAASGGFVRDQSDVAVAVIDTGIDLANADLNVTDGTNCVRPGDPAQDDNGHGTHVAGTIAARNTGAGVVGVAPGTHLYAVKVLGANGQGSSSAVICGIDWVTAHAQSLGIRVANMSLGGGGTLSSCANDPEHSAICSLVQAGVSVVAAAGNDNSQISSSGTSHLPAAYPEVLTVTAMIDTDGVPGGLGGVCTGNPDDSPQPMSNYAGPNDIAHTIAAPGGCVVSTALGGGTATMSGTSMAAPHVSGAIALCIDDAGTAGPCASQTPAQIIATLRQTAQDGATAANGFNGDPLHPGIHYLGYLVRASVPPVATTGSASSIADNDATVAGTIDAAGRHASWWFELGPAADQYDETTTADSGDDPVGVQQALSNLDAGTTYHYRLVVLVDGWTVHGADQSFTTTGIAPPPPPDTSIDSAPATLSTTGFTQIEFSGTPPAGVDHFECRLDSPTWNTCTSPFTVSDVGDGAHSFHVRAIGTNGRTDKTPAALDWTVDTTPPDTSIGGHPSDPTSNTFASIAVLSSESGSTFECQLDAEDWAPCGAAWHRSGLSLGHHVFHARATDAAGWTDQTPAEFEWTVVATTVTSGSPPPAGNPTPPATNETPFVDPPPVLAPPQRSRLDTSGAARMDRRHRRITLTLVCRGPGACGGRLELRSGHVRLGSVVVSIGAGARSSRKVSISRAALRRLARARSLGLALLSAPNTDLARSRVSLLTHL